MPRRRAVIPRLAPHPGPAPEAGISLYGDAPGAATARCDDVWKSIEWGAAVLPPPKLVDEVPGDSLVTPASHLNLPPEQSSYVPWEAPRLIQSETTVPARAASHSSFDTPGPSSAGSTLSTLSSLHTDLRDTVEPFCPWSSPCTTPLDPRAAHNCVDQSLICLGPRCGNIFASTAQLEAHVKASHAFACAWSGCDQPSFASSESLVWHIKAEHLLVCPVAGCVETVFDGIRGVTSHVAVAHPEAGKVEVKEWQLSTPAVGDTGGKRVRGSEMQRDGAVKMARVLSAGRVEQESVATESLSVAVSKRKCQDQLRSVVEKKAKKTVGTPRAADSPTDLVRSRASRLIETASFPLVFEHAILPFLAEFLPKWSGPRHVVSVTRGRTPQSRRICIMTRRAISRARRIIIAYHVGDLLPDKFFIAPGPGSGDLPPDRARCAVSFVFSTGRIGRMTWARGLDKDHMDDICAPRNPFHFPLPCMGDSIGICGDGSFEDSTATLGPCLTVGGASFWLGNFHPFLEAYGRVQTIQVEHPSAEDRIRCLEDGHDAMSEDDDFKLGRLEVTSGLNLKTTRLSHDPYWTDCCQEAPFVVTDWALIASRTARPNMLRRFPSETQPPTKERLVTSIFPGVPAGAPVISSGRTSGHQRGQICEIPAYVSGEENGTQKATREWFVEEPYTSDDEEAWIRGGIGVEGDSGAAVVDAETGSLIGQLWGRNRYWGPGPRHTFFTPVADIFDDIQEKCGIPTRPSLPQHGGGDDADRYPVFPSCRQCYDLRIYLDSRRSSRMSLQSMYMGRAGAGEGEGDQDLVSLEAVSELATPLDYPRSQCVEEAGASFNSVLSPVPIHRLFPAAPLIADGRSPYAMTLSVEDLYDVAPTPATPSKKRTASASWTGLPMFEAGLSAGPSKKHKADD